MEPLVDSIRRDIEHGGDVGGCELFPRRKAEHLGVLVVQLCRRREDELAFEPIDDRLLRAARRTTDQRRQATLESLPTCRAAPLVADFKVRDAVEPDQGRISRGNAVETTPGGEEHFRHRIVDEVARQPPTAEIPDWDETAAVQLREQRIVVARHEGCGA